MFKHTPATMMTPTGPVKTGGYHIVKNDGSPIKHRDGGDAHFYEASEHSAIKTAAMLSAGQHPRQSELHADNYKVTPNQVQTATKQEYKSTTNGPKGLYNASQQSGIKHRMPTADTGDYGSNVAPSASSNMGTKSGTGYPIAVDTGNI